MDFALVSSLVMLLVLALVQLAFMLQARSVMAAAAEDAVRVAASFGGDTSAGDARFRSLMAREIRADAITSLTWATTLDTLTLRVRSRLPLLGPLASISMITDASAYREAWP